MKRISITASILLLGTAYAQSQQPRGADLTFEAARAIADRNPGAALDDLSLSLMLSGVPGDRTQQLSWVRSLVQLGADEARQAIAGYRHEWPASPARHLTKMLEGDLSLNQGNYADALKTYQSLNLDNFAPRQREAVTFRMAFCYMMLGEDGQARTLLADLGHAPYKAAARFYVGYLDYCTADYDAALQAFAQCDRKHEPASFAPYFEAQIYFANGEYQRAIDTSTALATQASTPQLKAECDRLIGESLYNLGRKSEALPYLWRYIDQTPAERPVSPAAFYILGLSEYEQGNWDNAVKLLQRAVGSHSAMEQSAYLVLGQAYLKRGDSSQAMMAFENAYRVDYDRQVRETAFYNYAVALSRGANVPFANSVSLLEDFLQDYPNSQYANDVRRYVVSALMTDNDYDRALAILDQAADTPDLQQARQRILFVLGTRNVAKGAFAKAQSALEQAVQLNADPSITRQARLWLGDAYYRMANYPAAVKQYRTYLNESPDGENATIAQYDLAYALFADQRYKEALAAFNKFIKGAASRKTANNLLADAYNRAGDCLYYMRDFGAAQRDYDQALKLNPTAGDYAMFQTAIMQGLQGNHGGKIATIDRLASQYPSSGLLPAALLAKAESQTAMGHAEQAIATYEELTRTYPNTQHGRNGLLQLAITRLNTGDRQGAIDTYKKVVITYPTSDEARLATDDLKRIMAADGTLPQLAAFLKSVPGSPALEVSEMETLTFQAAADAYAHDSSTKALDNYVKNYPGGAHEAQALYYLAQAAFDEGDNGKAQAMAAQLLLTHPDAEVAEDVLLIKARAEEAQGKTEVAMNSYRELEERASGATMSQQARLGAMRTAAQLGKASQVLAMAEKLAASSAVTPDNQNEITFLRAQALDQLKRYDEAYGLYQELEKDLADAYGARAAMAHAESAYKRGQTKQARKLAQSVIESNTPQAYYLARAYILYSDILRDEGNKFEADEYLRSLRQNYPGNEAEIFKMIDKRLK